MHAKALCRKEREDPNMNLLVGLLALRVCRLQAAGEGQVKFMRHDNNDE